MFNEFLVFSPSSDPYDKPYGHYAVAGIHQLSFLVVGTGVIFQYIFML
ncbi:hypothetical protein SAMN06265218_11427 [Fodinibius sediminis]|uniref:Uncharacterized protein n=1 Tax=Fodinibius sediminis TaxID=1214077 RepID=A0A521EAJ2_9BACT|nr:hypothetical protein SAMN06265218_11427 [Fodinibius sediminis]